MIHVFERVRTLWRREPRHPFDVAYGMDTSGLIYADRLPSGHENDRYSEGYYGTAPSLFIGAISLWMSGLAPAAQGTRGQWDEGTGELLEDYTFVDLGCGKGRVVMCQPPCDPRHAQEEHAKTDRHM